MNDLISKLSLRDKTNLVEHYANSLPQITFEQTGLKLRHYFTDGIYARELFIPKGIVLTGKIHKYDNLCIMPYGKLAVSIDNRIQYVTGPITYVAEAGIKRIAHALEDTLWINIHRTDEVDLEKIENHFIAQTEADYLEFLKQQPELPFEKNKCLT